MQLSKIFLRWEYLFLISLLVIGFALRLYRFDGPVADWHSWRQADTSSVSRIFVEEGFDLLRPKFQDLSNVPSGLDNPNGYRFVEFPIYNALQAGLFKVFGSFTLEEWGRLVSIFASLFSATFIFLLIKKRFGSLAGFLSAFFFLFIPFNIYFSRTILPDPSMVMASLGGIYFFDRFLEKNKLSVLNINFLLSLVLTASAILLKPYALFFTIPMIFLAFEKFGVSAIRKWQLYVFLALSLIPFVLWRSWIVNFPQGVPENSWLFNKDNIRFKGSFFYWIFADRIGRLISGYFGIALIIQGLLYKFKKNDLLFILSFVFSSLLYVAVMAGGNVQHDYYQILIIPALSILMGLGGASLLENLTGYRRYLNPLILVVCIFFTFFFGWYFVRDYFNINNRSIIEAGAAVQRLTPKDAKVIANYNGDTSFLYQTNRKGWASFEKPLPEMINNLGADYLILVNPTSVDLNLGRTYRIISQNQNYVIFNLREKP